MNKKLKASTVDSQLAKYDHAKIEAKWRDSWLDFGIYEPLIKGPFDNSQGKEFFYNLMMFPYPSAEGLHVGNMYAFVGSDIYGRFKRMRGFEVFEPIGLDGFGIHSENYAMKIGKHPADLSKTTQKNFYRQLGLIGNGFAWSKALETYDPLYYKWTQWIFVQLFKAGLAYRGDGEVNWCPSCLTVLADEQVIGNQEGVNVCERCGTEVIKKKLTQWYFRITHYAQQLLDGLDKIDWSEKVSLAQRNWIGRSQGAEILFSIDIDKIYSVPIFTTRPDTLYGVTFLALAVDHPLVTTILKQSNGQLRQAISKFLDYSNKAGASSPKARGEDSREGIFTGFHSRHPLTGKEIPVYIASYVVTGYGTGAVMGVPAHDQRDWEFAKKHNIEITKVVESSDEGGKKNLQEAFTQYGKLVKSENFNGLTSEEAIKKIVDELEKRQLGKSQVNWHLRDWIISRQRYWGPPIPMIYCEKCASQKKSWFTLNSGGGLGTTDWNHFGWYPVEEEELPVELPYVEKFKPTGSGVSPLAQDKKFINTKCPGCGADAKRETDVSDTFLDSSWYFLRYPSIQKTGPVTLGNLPWDEEITKRWLPVDMYIGGAEHSVLHLLYSRFVTKVFYDLGLVTFDEPFAKFRAHGLLIKDGAKMSKSKGNVVNPDDYIAKFGADTLRAYLMFCGRYSEGGDFRDEGIEGMHRFLKRVWKLVVLAGPAGLDPAPTSSLKVRVVDNNSIGDSAAGARAGTPRPSPALEPNSLFMMHKTIKKVTGDIENLSYNTAIAALMEWMNFLEEKISALNLKEIKALLLLLAPFAPHMTEELWQMVIVGDSNFKSIHLEKWPEFSEKLTQSDEIMLIVQVNGRVRDKIKASRGITKDEAIKLAKESKNVSKYIAVGSEIKIIYVPEKIVNLVTSS